MDGERGATRGVRPVGAALRRYVRAADPLWLTRWLFLLVLLLDSLRYGVLDGRAPTPVLVGLGVIALAVVVNLLLRAAEGRAGDQAALARVVRWAFLVDVLLVTVFVGLYSFAPASGHHLLLFLLVVEGATVLGAGGALGAWTYGALVWAASWAYTTSVLALPMAVDRLVYPLIGTGIVAVAGGLLARRIGEQQRLVADALASRDRELAWRRALIDMLAHDLRAPMATAATSAELLAARSMDLPREQIALLSDAGRRQIRRALRLLDDLLDLGRARAGALELQHELVPLDAFVAETLDELPGRFAQDVALELWSGPAVVAAADRSRLAQVLWNLLTNAHKHGAPPIRIRLADGGDGTVELEVADHGPGVPPEGVGAMYEPFTTGGGDGSTGLGLWISQLLVGAMGGELSYVRSEGLSRFIVRLPAGERPAEGAGTVEPGWR